MTELLDLDEDLVRALIISVSRANGAEYDEETCEVSAPQKAV